MRDVGRGREVLVRIGKWESKLEVMGDGAGKRKAGWTQMGLREVAVGEWNGK